ncbi:hypothetical protein SAY86_019125 [Trapa natans]|uniref:Uncharacterized protein n=1 Tax=Trapa natans TaxID=22666 RepID=A0AAN7QZH7_TRANT|nr:hypothetical protein SAY86_019125 [Trapa natans]
MSGRKRTSHGGTIANPIHIANSSLGFSGGAGGGIVLLGPATALFANDPDMDRGAGDRLHRVPKKCGA